MTRVLTEAARLAAIIAFCWAVCALAMALEPFAMIGAA